MNDDSIKQGGIPRREALKVIGSIPVSLAATQLGTEATDHAAHASVLQARTAAKTPFKPKFFTDQEWKTANLLADMIIPKDDKSAGASESGAVEYIDEYADFRGEALQTELRGGLMWLDRECAVRYDRNFVDCSEAQRREILDLIAFPSRARSEHSQAVAFFNQFRDLTASGFYTSKAGIADLGYTGNRPYDWKGCPEAVLTKLGVK